MHHVRIMAASAALAILGSCLSAPPPARWPDARQFLASVAVPAGFEVQVVAAEPDVLNPVALDFDARGRAYVLECLQYPTKAPPSEKGKDRILILEDTDGDGEADRFTTFADGLNLASGLAVGYGGVFVAQAPELLFLEDTDGDDRADRRTVLLEGWAFEDTHETISNLLWGPDGWLYGCHGIMHRSTVRNHSFTAAVWRYHPRTRNFEVFAEGTNNPWGLDYDETGAFFLSTSVIPHAYHVVPGGFHNHPVVSRWSHPHAYGEIPSIVDHRHFPSPGQAADPGDPAAGGGHAHSGCLIYQGGAFPPPFDGRLLIGNLHGNRLNADALRRNGSTYVASHAPDFLRSSDPKFRPIHLRTGPDGAVYLLAWHAVQICHNTNTDVWDRGHGRIFRITVPRHSSARKHDLARLSAPQLTDLLVHPNSWVWRQALLTLAERQDRTQAGRLRDLTRESPDFRHSLRALWALHNTESLDEPFARELLTHRHPAVRGWVIRLLDQPGRETEQVLLRLARQDPSPDVRLELACASVRWKGSGFATELVAALLERDEDALDPVIPKMIWLAVEPTLPETFDRLLRIARPMVRRPILPWATRRLLSGDGVARLNSILTSLASVEEPESRAAILDGVLDALKGKRLPPPKSWNDLRAEHPEVRRRLLRLGLHFGDAAAAAEAERRALDARLPVADRLEAVTGLALARVPGSVGSLISLVRDGEAPLALRREALQALRAHDGKEIPFALLESWSRLPEGLRRDAIGLLSLRVAWARLLIQAVAKGAVPRDELTEGDVRKMLDLRDAHLARDLESAWGRLRERTPSQIQDTLARFRRVLAEVPSDRSRGRKIFEKTCMACHVLHGQGKEVGPDLTGANRHDPEYLLVNILDPNRVVGQAYAAVVVRDRSGRVETGLLAREAAGHVTLKAEGGRLVEISRSEIDALKVSEISLMPEGLAAAWSDQDFSDLVGFLMEDLPMTRGVWAGPFRANQPLDVAFPVERGADATWTPFRIGPTGRVVSEADARNADRRPSEACAYVACDVRSGRRLQTTLVVDAASAVKVWLNGAEAGASRRPVQGLRLPVTLEAGVNRFLFKVANTSRELSGPAMTGACWIQARWSDPGFDLEIVEPKNP